MDKFTFDHSRLTAHRPEKFSSWYEALLVGSLVLKCKPAFQTTLQERNTTIQNSADLSLEAKRAATTKNEEADIAARRLLMMAISEDLLAQLKAENKDFAISVVDPFTLISELRRRFDCSSASPFVDSP